MRCERNFCVWNLWLRTVFVYLFLWLFIWFKTINPLTPGAFCEKGISWTFWWFLGWISAKLALIWSKMQLHPDSLALLPLASRFATFRLGHAHKSKFWEKVTYVFRLLDFWNFFWPFLFLLFFPFCCSDWPSKKLLGKHYLDGQLLPWSSQVWWQQILVWVFHSTFWAFLHISRAPFGGSLWSGHHWKDLLLLQKLSIDDANFGQKWWRQKWKKGQGSSLPATAGMGVNRLISLGGLTKSWAPNFGCKAIIADY